jgi:phosphomannomutase
MDLGPIFKAYDIRGTSPGDLDEEAARLIGAAFASYAAAPVVAVGRDCRLSSPRLFEAFADGVTSTGADVWDVGEITTDMVYFVSGSESVPGAMITASHNPPEYNGIKLTLAGAKPVGADSGLVEIRSMAESGPSASGATGSVERRAYLDAYVDHLFGIAGAETLSDTLVVADGGNGMAGVALPKIFAGIAPRLDGLYLEPDGTFPNHPADPLRPENLVDLTKRMEETGADLGVAFDGDADRAFFIDDRLEPLSGSATTAIIAAWYLGREPGATVVHNLITSRAVPETIERLGGTPVRTRVGHSYIKAVMAETGAIFGGEHSGHYYFRENYRADSGMLAMLILLRVLSEDGRPLSELRKDYEPYAQSGEVNLEVADQEGTMRRVSDAFPDAEIDWVDGVTVSWSDRWFNLRPSNTEPVLRLNVEAPDETEVVKLTDEVASLVTGG